MLENSGYKVGYFSFCLALVFCLSDPVLIKRCSNGSNPHKSLLPLTCLYMHSHGKKNCSSILLLMKDFLQCICGAYIAVPLGEKSLQVL